MHSTAAATGKKFLEEYLQSGSKVLEVGSYDVNGTLRTALPEKFKWTGMDLELGPGVDIVADDPYSFPFLNDSFDACLSSSTFEHDDFFWLTFLEMVRVVKPGGFVYLNVPSNGYVHRHPADIWRFYPDAGIALEKWAVKNKLPVALIESFVSDRGDEIWCDFVAVFEVNSRSVLPRLHQSVKCRNINIYDKESGQYFRIKETGITGEIEELATAKAFVKRNSRLIQRVNILRRLMGKI